MSARVASANKNVSSRTPSRQLSWNNPTSNQLQAATNSNAVKTNRLKRRSKTQEDLNSNKTTTPKMPVKAKVQTNNSKSGAGSQTPNSQIKTSKVNPSPSKSESKAAKVYTKNDNTHKRIVSKKSALSKSPLKGQPNLVDILQPAKEVENEEPVKSETFEPSKPSIRRSISFRSSNDEASYPKKDSARSDKSMPLMPAITDNFNLEAILIERLEKQVEAKAFLSNPDSKSPFKDSIQFQQQASEVQARLMKQREEMRLQREKYLKEYKSQKRLKQEQESLDIETSYLNRIVPTPKVLTCK